MRVRPLCRTTVGDESFQADGGIRRVVERWHDDLVNARGEAVRAGAYAGVVDYGCGIGQQFAKRYVPLPP